MLDGLIVPKKTRLLVTGGRTFTDVQLVWTVLAQYLKPQMHALEAVIEGEAPGLDLIAKQWAIAHHVPVVPFPADWLREGVAAGPLRNQKMLDIGRPTVVLGFPGARGTRDMIQRAIKARDRKLVDNVIVVERCPRRWWTKESALTCVVCIRQGFHCVEAMALSE